MPSSVRTESRHANLAATWIKCRSGRRRKSFTRLKRVRAFQAEAGDRTVSTIAGRTAARNPQQAPPWAEAREAVQRGTEERIC